MKGTARALLGALALLAAGGPAAFAATATTKMNVTASVTGTCTLASPVALAFGAYDPIGANASTNLDVSPNALTVTCAKGVTAQISLDTGANASGTTRRMTDGTNYLTYEIYTSAARTTVWNTTNTVTYVASSKAPAPIPVYGRIPSGQDVAVSSGYADVINATVTF